MSHDQSRRDFLRASLAAAPLALAPGALFAANAPKTPPADGSPAAAAMLPTRALGKTGRDVTMLTIGGSMGAHSVQHLDVAWAMGVRYFDAAASYNGGRTEKNIAQWLAKHPERRKELFLVSKDHPRGGPQELLAMIDRRLAACGTDYLDLFFIHGIGTRQYGEASLDWPKGKELREVAQQLKQSGKVKNFGFSCHDDAKVQYLNNAAEGGFIDVIMIAYNPFMNPGEDMDKALDACHKAGIGLVAMKSMRGLGDVPRRVPEFDKLGLTTHQTVLHAIWSDPRIASICSEMESVEQLKQNTAAALAYKAPLKKAHLETLRELALLKGAGMCPNCDGSCRRACGDVQVALSDIARYVNYYERGGDLEARDLYQALAPEHRDMSRADLAAATAACKCGLDFTSIVQRAERYFG